jgi:hypothetical protein
VVGGYLEFIAQVVGLENYFLLFDKAFIPSFR